MIRRAIGLLLAFTWAGTLSAGAPGFPSLILERDGRLQRLEHNYHDAITILRQIPV
jgi:protein-disulfide isomerase-like protein with CxxC motif